MTSILDSVIYGPLFCDQRVSSELDDAATIRALLQVEAALAKVQARLGVIPATAGQAIAETAPRLQIAAEDLQPGTTRAGFPVIPLVNALRAAVGAEAAPYVHWGATTQDIMDTAFVLQARQVLRILEPGLAALCSRLAKLADTHRGTVMAGRTHSQQALPITFGLKSASWLAPLLRHCERLQQLTPRLLVVQFGGAAGTLAALGDHGVTVMSGLAEELELDTCPLPWHAQRDGYAEVAGWLSMLTGSLAKVAQDVILLAQTEVAEVTESAPDGRGGSSTMPQKNNPIASELIIAAARANASLLSAVHNAQVQEHERATHGWQLEWLTLGQMMTLTGGALKRSVTLAEELHVNPEAMRENLRRGNGTILAEAAVFALAEYMPRPRAHDIVKRACRIAATDERQMLDVVRELAAGELTGASIDWESLADPANYLGSANQLIGRLLDSMQRTKPQI